MSELISIATEEQEVIFAPKLLDGYEANEIGNCNRLIRIANGLIHWVDPWKTWIVYGDGKWEYDFNTVQMMELAKKVVNWLYEMAYECRPHQDVIDRVKELKDNADPADIALVAKYNEHVAHVKKSESEPMMKRMITLARGVPGVGISPDDIDNQPWLFNCQDATIDLRTGQGRLPDPADLLMQKSNVIYDPNAKCPLWDRYLSEWQDQEDVREFLQKICGSAITGIPVSKLFINVGSGQNGKSVFFDTIQDVIGSYAIVPDESLFMSTRNETHSEEKAKLKGARMMVINETDRGGKLNEPAIKKYNGGDLISARHLYGRPFSFEPTHTSMMHTNHKPSISGTDLGIWRRIAIIEWNFTVEDKNVDPDISRKLKTESSGILNWLIKGAQLFQQDLSIRDIPNQIKKVGEEYRKDQDHIGNFLRDVYGGGFLEETAGQLRMKYEAWCTSQGFKPWSAPNVGKELTSRHYTTKLSRKDGIVSRSWFYEGVTPLQIDFDTENDEKDKSLCYTKSASDQDVDTSCNGVTVLSYSSTYKKEEEEIKAYKGLIEMPRYTVTPLQIDPGPEFWAEQERVWREEAGFEMPEREPTQEEMEEAYLDFAISTGLLPSDEEPKEES